MSKVSSWFAIALAALAAAESQGAAPPPYPARVIRFIVPFTPGGSQDVLARLVGQRLADRFGQQVVIDNRPGAAGVIAAELTARAVADGYTILMATAGQVTIAPALHPKLSYDPLRDFAPVVHLADIPMALVASNSLPAASVSELIKLAKTKPKGLNCGSTGNGSISHLTLELFKIRTGLNIVHVAYKGAAPAFVDLIAGDVPLLFTTTASARPYIENGTARFLAVAVRSRAQAYPNVPTFAEAGIKGLEVPVWAGILTTAGTPRPAVERLYQESSAILKLPDVRRRITELGAEVVGDGPQAFGEMLKADLARWAEVVKVANIKD